MRIIYRCFRCNSRVSLNKKYISPGYFAVCFECDEDLLSFEVVTERIESC
jgi:hypothetical protein